MKSLAKSTDGQRTQHKKYVMKLSDTYETIAKEIHIVRKIQKEYAAK
jgi:hypothetical protein